MQVHMVGGYEDVDIKVCFVFISLSLVSTLLLNVFDCLFLQNGGGGGDYAKPEGYSFPLCCKLVETLHKRRENFHIQTLFVLGHNTKLDAQGNTCPIFNGCLVSLTLLYRLSFFGCLGFIVDRYNVFN